jgi:predicted amidohydrolase YtcJ
LRPLVLLNARIYPLDDSRTPLSALAIQANRILATGSSTDILAEFGETAEILDMGGKTILPGLTDAHIHLQNYALGLQKIDCETPTRQACLNRITEAARNTPPGIWILGHGWNQNDWPEGFGSADDLDKAAPDNPVYLTAKSLHAGWTNSQGLRLARLTDETPDPPNSRLGRDRLGRLNGLLFENAMEFINKVLPAPTTVGVARAIQKALPILWRMGLTGAHDFDRRMCFSALQSLQREGELRIRVVKSLPLEDLDYAIGLGLQSGFGNDFLRIGGIKAFADGALGPHTAAMLAPYEDDLENRGILILDAEELFEHGRQAVSNGLSLAVHAIGDRANHEVLEAFEQLRKFEASSENLPNQRLRHRIEHVQVIHPEDIPRLAAQGIVASMQPVHASSDMRMADRFWGSRAAYSYAWKRQLQHNAILAFGSDAPVESPNPFWGIHAAVTRQNRDGTPGPLGWYPDQRLTVQETLKAYTIGASIAGCMDDRLGRLVSGYLADLIVLDTDPFTCHPDQLHMIKPLATMIDGDWVWRNF